MNSPLTIRQRMILGILNTKKGITEGSYLASELGVSDRTIRSDIQAMVPLIMEYGAEIRSIRGKGYLIQTDQPELLQKLTYHEDTRMSAEERVRDIALYLIECDDPVPVSELEDELFVSRSTLDADLRMIGTRYFEEMPHITLIRSRQTVQFEADERKKRYLMNRLLTDHWNYNYEAGMHISGLPVPMDEFRVIEQLLLRFFRDYAIRLSEQDHIKFLFSLVIAVSRIRGGHEISVIPDVMNEASEERILTCLKGLAEAAGAAAKVSFSKNEIMMLADELAHRMLFSEDFPARSCRNEERKDEFADIIRRVLGKTDRENGLHLESDETLKSRLLFTLMNCYCNPYYRGMRHTEVIRTLKDRDPAAAAIALKFAGPVKEMLQMELAEETVMEMAAAVAGAMENAAAGAFAGGLKIALLSHLHISSSSYLMTKIQAIFGTKIHLEGPFSIYEYEWMERGSYDFVISTTKLRKENEKPPVLVISPLLTQHDLENIDYYLEEKKTAALFAGSRCVLGTLCQPDYYQVQRKLFGEDDLLAEIADFLGRWGVLNCSGRDALAKVQERAGCFAFSEGFLITVLRDGCAVKDFLAGMKLQRPMIIDEVPVKTVYVLTLSADSETASLFALEHLAHLLRRHYQERSPEKARYKDNLKKTVEAYELL